jgi:hypothetical protein
MASSILEARCSMTVLPSYSFARRTRVQLLFLQPGIHLGVNFEFRQAGRRLSLGPTGERSLLR